MKKVTALVLSVALVLGLTACGSTASDSASTAESTATVETTADAAASTEAAADSTATATEGPAPDWTAYDALIAEIKAETDFAKREALMHQAEDMLMETGAVIPIYYYNDIYMQRANLSNIYCNLFGYKFFMYTEGTDGTLSLNLASEPAYLDPALNSSVDGACLCVNSFGGLYTYDANQALVPQFAEGYTVSDDGMEYTFTLKSGLKWSDGSALTANDFVYSWNRVVDEKTAADYSYMFDIITANEDGTLAVEATDDTTLVVKLDAPCAYFLDLMAFPTFYPVKQEAVEAAADWETNPGAWAQEAGFVTSGAYTLKEWKHDESMVYVKNPNYYDAENVTVDELHFMLSADDTAIKAAYDAGDVDFIDTVPTDEIKNLLGTEEFHIIENLGTYYVAFNVNSPLFEGMTVEQANAYRKAITILIDRDFIVENVGQTGQQVATSFIPAGMLDGNGGVFKENDADYTYPDADSCGYYPATYSADSVTQAVELLKTAGFEFDDNNMLSANTPIKLKYLTNDGSGHIAVAQAIQSDLAVIGIEMEIASEEWNVFLDDRKAGNFDFAREGWLADFNDPINMLEMWTTDSGNNDCQFGR
ncbi:MAG: peptide ABC transporter substrate-binding protein [Lachnospiraceae bacterium]|nr:peptide ABC transporter substrate-binding protein [Lachnospiraceae bacterium]